MKRIYLLHLLLIVVLLLLSLGCTNLFTTTTTTSTNQSITTTTEYEVAYYNPNRAGVEELLNIEVAIDKNSPYNGINICIDKNHIYLYYNNRVVKFDSEDLSSDYSEILINYYDDLSVDTRLYRYVESNMAINNSKIVMIFNFIDIEVSSSKFTKYLQMDSDGNNRQLLNCFNEAGYIRSIEYNAIDDKLMLFDKYGDSNSSFKVFEYSYSYNSSTETYTYNGNYYWSAHQIGMAYHSDYKFGFNGDIVYIFCTKLRENSNEYVQFLSKYGYNYSNNYINCSSLLKDISLRYLDFSGNSLSSFTIDGECLWLLSKGHWSNAGYRYQILKVKPL